ncbi:MAG TPA: TetR/AcrR family transcriptional regulator [Solirubrobacteraceae bacterium]|jgi:AcrR family transcriptional regulator|nr:TetR/AcrR family transcriptional regulator [Solirubrobacteraceae bacterium]
MPPTSDARSRYHHGNLREALVEAAYGLARAGGPDAIVLREASRQVGVSHNAAYRHFPDRGSLLEAVAERCRGELADRMRELVAKVNPGGGALAAARLRLRATGRAYVDFAITEPGLFRTAFSAAGPHERPDAGDEPLSDEAGPFTLLVSALDDLDAAGGIADGAREHAEHAAWSAVHGFSSLCLDGPLQALDAAERDAALDGVLNNIERGLA